MPHDAWRRRGPLDPLARAAPLPPETSIAVVIHRVAAFTKDPALGNPAGVVLGAGDLGDAGFLRVAASADATATAFVERDGDGWRVRFFTPSRELDFCGHATLAAVGTLAREKELPGLGTIFRTKVGEIPVFRDAARPEVGWMIQPALEVRGSPSPAGSIAEAIGLDESDLAPDLPVTAASTGVWTLLVPLRSLEALRRARRAPSLRSLCEASSVGSVHPFTLETEDPLVDLTARHLSPEGEDPVTGTANGALAATLHRESRGRPLLTIAQGPGRVLVVYQDNHPHVGGPSVEVTLFKA